MGRRPIDRHAALDAAMLLFWEKGYEATSFDDLTSALGITKPTIYNHFGDKEHVFKASVEHYEHNHLGFIANAMTMATAPALAGCFLGGTLRLAMGHAAPLGCLITNALAGRGEPAAIVAIAAERRDTYLAMIERRLGELEEARSPSSSKKATIRALYLLTVAGGLCLQARAGASLPVLQAAVDLSVGHFATSCACQ